jgi:hypothetical protein
MEGAMEWYWWVLIVLGLAAVGALKLTLFNKWIQNRKKRESQIPEDE